MHSIIVTQFTDDDDDVITTAATDPPAMSVSVRTTGADRRRRRLGEPAASPRCRGRPGTVRHLRAVGVRAPFDPLLDDGIVRVGPAERQPCRFVQGRRRLHRTGRPDNAIARAGPRREFRRIAASHGHRAAHQWLVANDQSPHHRRSSLRSRSDGRVVFIGNRRPTGARPSLPRPQRVPRHLRFLSHSRRSSQRWSLPQYRCPPPMAKPISPTS